MARCSFRTIAPASSTASITPAASRLHFGAGNAPVVFRVALRPAREIVLLRGLQLVFRAEIRVLVDACLQAEQAVVGAALVPVRRATLALAHRRAAGAERAECNRGRLLEVGH